MRPKTSRRNMLAIAASGGALAGLAAAFSPGPAEAQAHDHTPVSGPLATATVRFGSTSFVICGVRGHFVNDNMYGFVRVLP